MNELKRITNQIHRKINKNIEITETLGAVRLEGQVDSWADVISAGKIAAKSSYRGVVNDLLVDGIDHRKVRKQRKRMINWMDLQ